ncbi:unnamed protein product [Ilex paraguariensis]|uniref:Late embryogenesis abundant protein LEA-2 subgroup domain-containing protein n=1 Tax=Ilex paraguariensis TaxID=185542 RepID=A0ABC8UNS2_9AQUA
MTESKSSRKGLKICCGITTVVLIIFLIVSVTLFFTVFKPKKPQITAHPASLENLEFQIFPSLSLNATVGLVVTIDNKNYGSFRFKNTTSTVYYHGTSVAEAPIPHGTVPARGKFNIRTYANFTADKLISSPFLWGDLFAGRLTFTSTSTLHGKLEGMLTFDDKHVKGFVETSSNSLLKLIFGSK